MKSLLKDTMVYGVSTVLGKFLNWLLTFLYVRVLLTSQFGQMTSIYAWTALFMILLTYGMETGFFRFANKSDEPKRVYSTALWSLGITSTTFVILLWIFLPEVSSFLGVSNREEHIMTMGLVVALDAFMAIPLAYLRYAARPWRFFLVRISFITITILATLTAFVIIPYLYPKTAEEGGILSQENRLIWVYFINLGANIIQLIILIPDIMKAGKAFDWKILKQMLAYSSPMILLGLAGSFNNQADKILFPRMFDNQTYGNSLLGIYSACYKLALVMVLFTQAFRYAYDPFIFAQTKNDPESSKKSYSLSMRYYILSTLIIFLGVMTSIDFLKYFVSPAYYGGLVVVPYIMIGQLMFGVYFNLAVWYKVTDNTLFGALLSILGCGITVLVIYLLSVKYGFMSCAWASVLSNGTIMIISYFLGQRYYKIDYQLKVIGRYVLITAIAYILQRLGVEYIGGYTAIVLKWIVLIIYIFVIAKMELPKGWQGGLSNIIAKIPLLNRLVK